jgi:hypothetical protein
MIRNSKIAAIVVLFCFVALVAIADRGGFGRKNKIHFNIITLNTLKNSVALNLKSGLNYKGNTVLHHQQAGNSIFTNSIVSYQKGNTIYLLPYKHRVLIQSFSPSSGYKLIIRSK